MNPLTIGNTAKLYCLNWIAEQLEDHIGEYAILDLGCGTAMGFVPLLQRYPQVRYVGLEPLEASATQARQNLSELNGKVVQGYGYGVYEMLQEQFDAVISFSTLEHVYRREAYLRSASECLKADGHILINYDAGHFVAGTRRDRIKNIVGPLLARFGIEQYYQSFVHEDEFLALVERVGLKVVDAKFFNTRLKGINHIISEQARESFIEHWLALELWLNAQTITYHDGLATSFFTRNFILKHL